MEMLASKGIRLSIEAEQIIKEKIADHPELEAKLMALGKPFIAKADVELLLIEMEKKPIVEVRQASDFNPIAKEYSADIKVIHTKDVTGKSRTKGEVDNFISYFRNRYERLSNLLRSSSKDSLVNIKDVKRYLNDRVRINALVSSKTETKKGNVLLEVEDMTGSFKVVISGKRDEKLLEKAAHILTDDVISISGKVLEPYIIADEIEWPEMPVTRERKKTENDIAIAYLSDTHFGSKYFLEREFKNMLDWLHGKGEAKELAGKVKYLLIAGDIVDGIGVYPNQEKELIVKDIYAQYRIFDDFIEQLPDWIEVVISPGNHDAVRRGEPMPAIGKDMISSDVTSVGNPSTVVIEGLKHIIYHATSIDSMIANLPDASYMHPEKVMVEYLKRRHLSPIYGGNLIIPENIDYMVIDDEPDVLHCGHVHKNGYMQYRGTVLINSGTFQARTEFQIKQGHVPTPAMVPIYEPKHGRIRTLDFKDIVG
jgi:DNA polymerase II small subunit